MNIVNSTCCLFGIAAFCSFGQTAQETALKNLKFRSIGPAIMGGRIDDFAVVESNPRVMYVGSAAGGIFKTGNGGVTWEPIFDDQPTPTIGDLALAPSDPSILYVGSGEPNNRQSSSWGNGVYKSMDGGKTWQHMGLKDTHHIGRVVVHPTDPNIVYVAALGHLWGPNHERGVFKSTDGGTTWTQSLYIDDDTGVSDLAIDPQSPNIIYAAAYERRRTVFGYNGGGPKGGLFRTIDGGAHWTRLTKGLPASGDIGRCAVEVYRKNPNIVYALVEHLTQGGIYRSEDKGATWTKMSDTNPRPSYYSQIRVDPNNDQKIWVLGAPLYYTEDGGRTFRQDRWQKIHSDFHAFWIDPANSEHMVAGSDGGLTVTYDGGRNWDYINNIPIGQFYEIAYDMETPYNLCGGLQDNNSWCGPSSTLTTRGPSNDEWVRLAAATVSTRASIRRTTTLSTPNRRTAMCRDAICAPANRDRSGRWKKTTKRRATASSGIRRCSSRNTTTRRFTTRATMFLNRRIAAMRGSGSVRILRRPWTATRCRFSARFRTRTRCRGTMACSSSHALRLSVNRRRMRECCGPVPMTATYK